MRRRPWSKCITTSKYTFRMLGNDVPTDRSITTPTQTTISLSQKIHLSLCKVRHTYTECETEKKTKQLHIFWILSLFFLHFLEINKMQITSGPHVILLASLLFNHCGCIALITHIHIYIGEHIAIHSCTNSLFRLLM